MSSTAEPVEATGFYRDEYGRRQHVCPEIPPSRPALLFDTAGERDRALEMLAGPKWWPTKRWG